MKLNIDMEIVKIICLVNDHFKDPDKTWLWMHTNNLNFGGISPLKLISFGRGKKVIQFIEAAKTGD